MDHKCFHKVDIITSRRLFLFFVYDTLPQYPIRNPTTALDQERTVLTGWQRLVGSMKARTK